ncbi:MAG TPA: choice-of-anchor E domain-containing protein [Isosphaeraceae bacterium]|nr:choice-of-anchor E domain-containing protein [Isosphaeraceae bacterium]
MFSRSFRPRLLTGALMGVVWITGGAALADLVQIVQKHDLGTRQTQVLPTSTESFNRFDSTLGTLESVTIELANVQMTSEIFAEYGGRGVTTVTEDIQGWATLQLPATLLPAGVSGAISPTFSLNFSRTMASSSDNFDVIQALNQDSAPADLILTFTGGDVNAFVGSSSFALVFSADASAVIGNINGGGTRGMLTYVTGTAQVLYAYTPGKAVPEPTSFLLGVVGLGGLALPTLKGRWSPDRRS